MGLGKWLDRQAMELLALRSLRDVPGVADVHYENQDGYRTCTVLVHNHPDSYVEFMRNAQKAVSDLQELPRFLFLPEIRFKTGEVTKTYS